MRTNGSIRVSMLDDMPSTKAYLKAEAEIVDVFGSTSNQYGGKFKRVNNLPLSHFHFPFKGTIATVPYTTPGQKEEWTPYIYAHYVTGKFPPCRWSKCNGFLVEMLPESPTRDLLEHVIEFPYDIQTQTKHRTGIYYGTVGYHRFYTVSLKIILKELKRVLVKMNPEELMGFHRVPYPLVDTFGCVERPEKIMTLDEAYVIAKELLLKDGPNA